MDRRVTVAMEMLERGLGYSETANHVKLSESRLRHLFTKETGVSPHQFQQARRLNRAACMLRSTFDGITMIAKSSGYDNSASFCKAFRNRFGRSPTEYRRGATP